MTKQLCSPPPQHLHVLIQVLTEVNSTSVSNSCTTSGIDLSLILEYKMFRNLVVSPTKFTDLMLSGCSRKQFYNKMTPYERVTDHKFVTHDYNYLSSGGLFMKVSTGNMVQEKQKLLYLNIMMLVVTHQSQNSQHQFDVAIVPKLQIPRHAHCCFHQLL